MKTKRLNLDIEPHYLEQLDFIVETRHLGSRTEAVRRAIDLYASLVKERGLDHKLASVH